jgi:hypothetical protein
MHRSLSVMVRLLYPVALAATVFPLGTQPAKADGPVKPSAIVVGIDPGKVDDIQKFQPCKVNAPAGYHDGACRIQIWRSIPISPPTTLSLPAGTHVYVELFEARQNESLNFALATNATGPHQVGATLLPAVIPGLNTITFSTPIAEKNAALHQFEANFAQEQSAPPQPAQTVADAIENRQDVLVGKTNTVLKQVQKAAAGMTCLSNYQAWTTSDDPWKCSQATMIDYGQFSTYKDAAFSQIAAAAALPLPINDVADLDSVVKTFYLTCLSYYSDQDRLTTGAKFCRGTAEALSTREGLLDNAITDIQKTDDTLIQNQQTLKAWVDANGAPQTVIFEYTPPTLTNLLVTITGTEVVSKTNNPIATVTINAQATHVAISTGIGFSNLKLNTYTSAPVVANGTTVLNPDGSVKTLVNGSATDFSVIAPLVLASYRINSISNYRWETRCPGSCSFLFSAGVGANLTAKEADFDLGGSFEIANVLFTPAFHFGSDVRLTDGVYVGQPSGSNPPSPLPTTTKGVRKGAIAVTYSIPIPNF